MKKLFTLVLGISIGAGATLVYSRYFQKPDNQIKISVSAAREKDDAGKLRISVDVSDRKNRILARREVRQELEEPAANPELMSYLNGWSAWEIYKGKRVQIPDSWIIHSFSFDGEGDIERKEKQTWLALGWRNYDAEAIVALGIFGNGEKVQAEITRLCGAEIHVLYKDKEVVAFPPYRGGRARGYYSKTFKFIK